MKLRYNCSRQTLRLRCSIMTISHPVYSSEATTVNAPRLDTQVAARLEAAFTDLASGHADRSSVEEALRAIGQDAQASGTGVADVVAVVGEAATSAIETSRDSRWEVVGPPV